ncbi:MAG: DUF5683 domain-containing protein, partial [bacterium]|nr:DUF5683 domain-containing protein [bacterium]
IPSPSWRAAAMSAVIPGSGQYSDGNYLRAGAFFVTAVVAFASYQSNENKVVDRIHEAQIAETQYRRSLSQESAKKWSTTADTRWRSAEEAARMRDQWATIVAVVWTSSALERLIFPTKVLQPVPVGSGAGVKLSWTLPGGNG